MSHRGAPRLRTPRLELVPFEAGDAGGLMHFFNHPDVGRYLLDGASVSRDWVEEEVRESRRRFEDGSVGLWKVETRLESAAETGDQDRHGVDGIVGYRPFFDPPELQLLYALHPSLWGRGIATEAARAAVDYAFDVLGLEEIRAATDAPNIGSIRVLERLGMSRWKTTPGTPYDTIFFRVGVVEWGREAGRAALPSS